MAVLRITVGLLPLPGLPVPSLRFPVNPESPQTAAFVRTIGLASPAPPAYEETHAAEAATNLDQKQSGLQRCKSVRSRDRNKWFVGLPIVPELFFKARSCSFGPFLFLSFQLFGESIKKGPSFYRRAEDGSKTMSRLIGSSL
jgi:hypothetical protein